MSKASKEWTKVNRSLADVLRASMLKPGMLIRYTQGKSTRVQEALVGNLNDMGGVCDCCTLERVSPGGGKGEITVIEYKVVYEA